MTGFQKINHFVTFHTLNIYSWKKYILHRTNKHYIELSVILYHELPETLQNILIAASVLLWQQGKVLGSIYFMHDKVVDFPKSYSNAKSQFIYLIAILLLNLLLYLFNLYINTIYLKCSYSYLLTTTTYCNYYITHILFFQL